MRKKTMDSLEVRGKKVYVRVDYNVPLDADGVITDDTRIRATLPTLRQLLDGGAALILASHMGRPKGKRVAEYSLAPAAKRLSQLLERPVRLAPDCIGEETKALAQALRPGEILMLENVRFHPEEEANDPEFAQELAALADVAVNDAFGVSHRAHASVVGVARVLPMAAGRLVAQEIHFLEDTVTEPKRPFVAIIGGAKVSDKIAVLERLVRIADTLIIGGGMANTFLLARGMDVGTSLVETDARDLALRVLRTAEAEGKQVLLPSDVVTADAFREDAEPHRHPATRIPADEMVLDIGPETAEAFAAAVLPAATVLWNGPMGVFEWASFADGTKRVAEAVAANEGISIVGGGDSVAAIESCGLADRVTHISTGGGASLAYLEGKELPGIECLAEED